MSDFISQAVLRSSIYNIPSNGRAYPLPRAKHLRRFILLLATCVCHSDSASLASFFSIMMIPWLWYELICLFLVHVLIPPQISVLYSEKDLLAVGRRVVSRATLKIAEGDDDEKGTKGSADTYL